MGNIYQSILKSIQANEKLLAVLIDPDKFSVEKVLGFIKKVNESLTTHIFIGGSTVNDDATEIIANEVKKYTLLPVILFPGNVNQITDRADALLFLSLISGRNPEYLIGQHVKAISKLRNTNLEIISTGYILIENGKKTAVEKVTGTQPMNGENVQDIVDTAKAGELMGMKLIYLEAGSGASNPVSSQIISQVKAELQIPLIVGGGIRNKEQLGSAYNAGADLIVIGTAFEDDESFLNELKSTITSRDFSRL